MGSQAGEVELMVFLIGASVIGRKSLDWMTGIGRLYNG